jgi:hypothetical protein
MSPTQAETTIPLIHRACISHSKTSFVQWILCLDALRDWQERGKHRKSWSFCRPAGRRRGHALAFAAGRQRYKGFVRRREGRPGRSVQRAAPQDN